MRKGLYYILIVSLSVIGLTVNGQTVFSRSNMDPGQVVEWGDTIDDPESFISLEELL